jgi:hypothetical protein
MVYKMNSRKKIFLDSLVFTLLVLIIGFSLGFYVEYYRVNGIIEDYSNYEIEALDLKLQNYYYQIMDRSSCDAAIEQNFIFADDLYNRGLEIELFEEASQISDDILREKKRYVLLKTELWLNTLLLKEKCDNPFDTVVYFYSNDPNNNAIVSQQKIISNVLSSVKETKGNKIVLIPIAGDMGLKAVDLQRRIYGIDRLPSIMINENEILEGFYTEEEIISYLR